jgi:hypothetical protein
VMKVGRRRALTAELETQLCAEMALFRRAKRDCNPAALARKYHLTLNSLRTGRQRALTAEQEADLCADLVFYRWVKRDYNPVALARKYHLSIGSLRNYNAKRHKSAPRAYQSFPSRIAPASHFAP